METEVGIISFKNMKAGFMGFCFKDGIDRSAPVQDTIDAAMLGEFTSQLVALIVEILNPDIPFVEKT